MVPAHDDRWEFTDEPREQGWRAALRRPAAPESGMRVAYAYAVAAVAALLGMPLAFVLVTSLYDGGRICVGDDGLACPVVWMGGLVGGTAMAVLALGAWFYRLGWRWWLSGAALALGLLELVVDPFSPWMLLGVAIPGLAAVASDPSLPQRRGRTTGIVALAVVVGGVLLRSLVG